MGQSALGLSSAWLASNWPEILRAGTAGGAGAAPAFVFFNSAQAADIEAMSAQIIPTDEHPGAREARCVHFIDRALASFLRKSQPLYIDGLRQLSARADAQFHERGGFAALGSEQQIQLLTQIEREPFFTAVRAHTVIGFLASPVHGGNFDRAGWKLIGFEDSLRFEPPFGYYDGPSGARG